MLNVPNAITVLRFALVPVIAWLAWGGAYGEACVLFAAAALSDLADGLIARRWGLCTRFGAIADPLADKLTTLTLTIVLALQHELPWWFASAVVGRDAVIVTGAVAYHLTVGSVEMAPTRLSKLNTGLEFVLLLGVLAVGAGYVDSGPWREALLAVTLTTIVLSGVQYVLVWARKAAAARRSVG